MMENMLFRPYLVWEKGIQIVFITKMVGRALIDGSGTECPYLGDNSTPTGKLLIFQIVLP
jgi:hypothetical protein